MPKTANRKSMTERLLRGLKAKPRKYLVWDERVRGLAVEVQPSSRKAWKFIYSHGGRGRWYTIGPVDGIGIDAARSKACRLIGMLADDRDPMAERMAERNADTFHKLADPQRARQETQQVMETERLPDPHPRAAEVGLAQGRCHHPRRCQGTARRPEAFGRQPDDGGDQRDLFVGDEGGSGRVKSLQGHRAQSHAQP
jgi:hypothetical protein